MRPVSATCAAARHRCGDMRAAKHAPANVCARNACARKTRGVPFPFMTKRDPARGNTPGQGVFFAPQGFFVRKNGGVY